MRQALGRHVDLQIGLFAFHFTLKYDNSILKKRISKLSILA